MADPADLTCEVAVLLARPGSSETLVESTGPEDAVRLPTVVVPAEPQTALVLAAVGELLGQDVTLLRLNTLGWEPERFDATRLMVEVEGSVADAPAGFTWRRVEAETPVLEPAWVRDSCADWLRERAEGWSELRPPWSRPGWFATAAAWMTAAATDVGRTPVAPPRIHYLWGISVVLVCDTGRGPVYLKCSTETFRHEAVLTQGLAARSSSRLPEVLAVEPDHGWLLMAALPSPELGELPEEEWAPGLRVLAELQQEWVAREEELLRLGAAPRPLSDLAAWVAGTEKDAVLLERLEAPVREAWQAAVPSLVVACHRLDALGPGPSLVHGDFHPWNVAGAGGETRVFDWTDGAVSHPFVDVVSYVMRAKDVSARRLLMGAYLDRWRGHLDAADLEEAGRLALVVGSLYQAQTYTRLVPTVMPADRTTLQDGDVQWMRRALDRITLGLDGDY